METKVAHTPGPWESSSGEVTTEREDGRSYRRIAAIQDYGGGSLREVDEANARLIAAAPDLLEALDCIARGLTNGQIARGETFESIARAAIAKATGQ